MPPVGTAKNIADTIAVLKQFQQQQNLKPGDWIVGYGYDGAQLAEQREITRDDLDPAFPDNPVMLIHVSGHGCVLNSAGFKKFNMTAKTPTPPGGVILRKPGTNEPAGLVMESAYLSRPPGCPRQLPCKHLGGLRESAEARRREDRIRRFAPSPDRLDDQTVLD